MSAEDIIFGILIAILLAVGVCIAAMFYIAIGVLLAFAFGIAEWSTPWIACVVAWPFVVSLILAILRAVIVCLVVVTSFAKTWRRA